MYTSKTAPAFALTSQDAPNVPRDWHTGAPLPDYSGPVIYYSGGESTMLYTAIIDGERQWSGKPCATKNKFDIQ